MPVIRELARHETGTISDPFYPNSRSFARRGWLVSCASGADPRLEPGIPQIRQDLSNEPTPDNRKMLCLNVHKYKWHGAAPSSGLLPANGELWEVVADFASAQYRGDYGWRFVRESVSVPVFYSVPRVQVNQALGTRSVLEWHERPYQLELTYTVLESSVYTDIGTFTARDAMRIRAEVGKLHVFGEDYSDNSVSSDERELYWRFEPPTIIRQKDGKYRIEYAWINDPGNPALTLDNVGDTVIYPTMPRKPFHRYNVQINAIGSAPFIEYRPVIEVVPMFPFVGGSTPWINRGGELTLPGGPSVEPIE